jgi:hypothetical protein
MNVATRLILAALMQLAPIPLVVIIVLVMVDLLGMELSVKVIGTSVSFLFVLSSLSFFY